MLLRPLAEVQAMTIPALLSFRAKTLLAVITVLFTTQLSLARVINVPGDAPTIQAGINAASNGDMVLVAPGMYREIINFSGKAITVTSSGGASVTIIDGGQQGTVVTFDSNETNASVLNGFTIQNGNAGGPLQEGGGIDCAGTAPTITNNVIQNNVAGSAGGGVGVGFGSPIIQNNVIRNNSTTNGLGGGGVSIRGASEAQIIGNVILNNSGNSYGGGIQLWAAGGAIIENNVISGNTGSSNGGGISMYNDASHTVIAQNLIEGNTSQDGNGIYWSDPPAVLADNTITDSPLSQGGASVVGDSFLGMVGISNNIIVASGGANYAFSCTETNFPPNLLSYSDVFSSGGTPYGGMCTNQTGTNGNISADPKFATNEFALQPSSPAIDTGNNNGINLLSADILNNPRIVNGKGGDSSAVVDMGAYEFFPNPIQWVSVTPCRLVDTRGPSGPFGGPSLAPGIPRSFAIPNDPNCSIPQTALAYSLNVTALPSGHLGYLTIWPTGPTQPVVSTMNSTDGRTKASAAIVEAGNSEAISVFATDTTNILIDIDGYFTAPGSQTMQFYPLTPCRIVDTRNNQDGGTLQRGVERDYAIAGSCGVPNSATAYSLNVTVLPAAGGLDYLTVWPQGQTRPTVSTLNDQTGTTVANAAIVPAGSNNTTAFYPNSNDTDLLVDVNGYFAPSGSGGYSLYPVTPCRAYDSRASNGQPFTGQRTVNIAGSPCSPPSNAAGYVFNATVVPSPTLGYLTLWSHGQQQPTVSTLNAQDGFITSNMAIVPNLDGSTNAYGGNGYTQLILDILGYFAP
jgi:parallel beta-helix repeat protein